jgi:pyruvate/2-oxoglutarate dehydrogenase complex dihydrolipoamide dehydrogenase (E3) component
MVKSLDKILSENKKLSAIGRVGLTEAEIRLTRRRALAGKRPMTRVSRAVEMGETQGFMKIAVDAETQDILGAAILGVGVGSEAPIRYLM